MVFFSLSYSHQCFRPNERIKLVNMEYDIDCGMLEAYKGATGECMELDKDGWKVVFSNGKVAEERSSKENGDLYS